MIHVLDKLHYGVMNLVSHDRQVNYQRCTKCRHKDVLHGHLDHSPNVNKAAVNTAATRDWDRSHTTQ